MNTRTLQTVVILAALGVLTLVTGYALFGVWALVGVVGLLAFVGFSLPGTSGRLHLRGLRELRYGGSPELHEMVAALSRNANLEKTPPIYLSEQPILNAATVGDRSSNALIVTAGLLRNLSAREIYAVLAHEIAHIANEDLTLFRFTAALRQAIRLFSRVGWLLVLFALPIALATGFLSGTALLALLFAPLAATLLQAALLRTREFAADQTAARLTGDPQALAAALRRIEYVQAGMFRMMMPRAQEGHPLLRTHPPTDERVNRLLSQKRSRHVTGREPLFY